jgi:hypothetical protein
MYLEVKGNDNDFTHLFMAVLDSLWETIHKERMFVVDKRSDFVVFEQLHRHGQLKKLIIDLVSCKAITRNLLYIVESREVNDKTRWPDKNFYDKYFDDIELEFHKKTGFMRESQNGEHAWLDITKGTVGYF